VAGSLTGLTTSTTLVLKSSTPANGSNAEAGATATIVVTETNTGTASLTGVAVTPGGKCSAFTGGATTLAAGVGTDFTCTFTVTAGANAWTALGIGTDQFGAPAPATNESANGSLTGLAPATTLTTKSVTPAGSVEVGTLVTVVVTETNTGNSALTGVSVSGGGVCASFTGGATTLAAGIGTDFTCTFTAALGANAWFGDGHGTDLLGNPVPSTGEHTSGSTTGLQSYLIINKIAEGASGTFGFSVAGPTPSTPSVSATTGGPTTFTGTTGPFPVHTGPYVINETTVPSAQWVRIGATCTIGALTGGANFEWGFTMPLGVTVTCTFDNAFVPSATTRTQGFWATHTCLSNAVWNGTANPCGTTNLTKGPVPPSLATICVVPITALAVPGENQLMGGFWANIANLSTAKGKTGGRTAADKARMQMLQQYLAAVLNFLEFGSVPDTFGTTLSGALAVYCNPASTAAQITTIAGELDAFNSSGDAGLFNPGINASPQESKIEADIDFWDDPTTHSTDFK
jgi:hypothetical protein